MNELIEWFRETFEDGSVISWYMDNLLHEGVASGWVDVCIPGMEEIKYNWVWTVEAEPDEIDDSIIVLGYDRNLHFTYTDEGDEVVVVTNFGDVPTEEQVWKLCEKSSDCDIETVGGWSIGVIESALEAWCREHVGRSYIFSLNEDPDLKSPLAAKALAALEAYESGDEPEYDLGDNVIASNGLMDFLLTLPPDEAAEVTEKIKEICDGL